TQRFRKAAANWVATELLRELKRDERGIAASPVPPGHLAELVALVEAGTISGKIGKEVFEKMYGSGRGAKEIVEAEGLVQLTDEAAIERLARAVVGANPKQVEK